MKVEELRVEEGGAEISAVDHQTGITGKQVAYGLLGVTSAAGLYLAAEQFGNERVVDDAALMRSIEVCARSAQYSPEICTPPHFSGTVDAMRLGFMTQGLTGADTRRMGVGELTTLVAQRVAQTTGPSWLETRVLKAKAAQRLKSEEK